MESGIKGGANKPLWTQHARYPGIFLACSALAYRLNIKHQDFIAYSYSAGYLHQAQFPHVAS